MPETGKVNSSRWLTSLIVVISISCLLISIVGGILTWFYLGVVIFEESGMIIDPIGLLVFIIIILPGLVFSPLLYSLSRILSDINTIRIDFKSLRNAIEKDESFHNSSNSDNESAIKDE